MTLASTPPLIDYLEDGITLSHPIPFQFQLTSEIVCSRLGAGGTVTPLTLGVDFTVTGGAGATGTVTKTSSGVGTIFRVQRVTQETQATEFVAGQAFPAENVELALDRSMAVAQETASGLALLRQQTIRGNDADNIPPLAAASSRISKFMQWALDGKSVLLLSASDMAQALVAPIASLLGAAAKGDPGGNIMAIGLFAFASTLSIPLGTDTVRTSGHTAIGKGIADYVADATVNAAYVAANPRSSFISANGRGFRYYDGLLISPYHFGAAGIPNFTYADDGNPLGAYTDDTTAVQAWADYVAAHPGVAEQNGAFAVSSGITLGGSDPKALPTANAGDTATFVGNMWLVATTGIPILLTVNAMRQANFVGRLGLIGQGGFNFASRTCDVAVKINGYAQLVRFSGIFAQGFRYTGCLLTSENPVASNDFACDLGVSFFIACGTGTGTLGLSATFTGHTDSFDPNSLTQTSTITPSVMPPVSFDNYFSTTPGNSPLYIYTNGEFYYVNSFNRAAGTISVTPTMPASVTGGTLNYVMGSGVQIEGGDAGVQGGENIVCSSCGIGINFSPLYPPRFRQAVLQNNFVGVGVGSLNDSVVGGGITSCYFEGNTANVICAGAGVRGSAFFTIDDAQGDAVLSKVQVIAPRETITGAGTYNANLKLCRQLTYGHEGRRLEPVNDEISGVAGLFFDCPDRGNVVRGDNPLIQVTKTANTAAAQTLYGYFYQTVKVVGTGSSGQPTGSVTLSQGPNSQAIKFNGGTLGASLVLAGFTQSAIILVEKDQTDLTGSADNFIVTVLSGKPLSASVTYDPPSIAAAGTTTTTVAVTGAALGDRFVASFSNSLNGVMISAYVSSANTVTVVLFNPTGGAVDLASGTLKVSKVA